MSESLNKTFVLAERPKDAIIPGKTFELKSGPRPTAADLKDDQVLVENLYLSLDPAMRGWLNDSRSYVPPVQIGEKMRGPTISRVLASKSSKAAVGDFVTAMGGWTEVAVVPSAGFEPVTVPANGKLTDTLSVLGFTGLTAYFGILEVGNVKAGDFVVVSGAAGATGSIVGQIAKLKGAKVLGIAGSDDKVAWLKEELGFDDAINYKDKDFAKIFKEKTKDLIDLFFDNTGGEALELALSRAKPHATFVMCGAISQYNSATPQGPKNYTSVITMRIRMQGFIVMDYIPRFPEARKELSTWLAEGKIKRKETILKGGLEAAEKGLIDLYNGVNTGKLLVEIKPEAEGDGKSRL